MDFAQWHMIGCAIPGPKHRYRCTHTHTHTHTHLRHHLPLRTHASDKFLVMSNINSWIECSPGSIGSLVSPADGDIKCKNVKPSYVAKAKGCAKMAPNRIFWHPYGE